MTARGFRNLSLWWDTLPTDDYLVERPPVTGTVDADVAIIGGGLTGLWSAYYLSQADPRLRIHVVEAAAVGFGASGRNGGWCSGLLPIGMDALAAHSSRESAIAMLRAAQQTVDEVGRVCEDEKIDAHFAKGGYLRIATSLVQLERLKQSLVEERRWDQTEEDITWLDRDAARQRIGADGVFGAVWTPHCAAVHPARLVRGLAAVVERNNVVVHEHSPVRRFSGNEVRTDEGVLTARHVVRATEGYTALLPGLRRAVLPMTSMMIATEPLPAATWDSIGWNGRDTLNDERRFLIYAQRTGDGRIAIGGRGAPYRYGSRVAAHDETSATVHESLRLSLIELFPQLADVTITHRWGGTLGIPRDWFPSVIRDPQTGVIAAGGYSGDGVALTNLAGRTVADLITRPDSSLLTLPWVGHQSPAWEPEPLRWLGINAGVVLARAADDRETRTGRPAALHSFALRHLIGQ